MRIATKRQRAATNCIGLAVITRKRTFLSRHWILLAPVKAAACQ
jgi:hypothetical protein